MLAQTTCVSASGLLPILPTPTEEWSLTPPALDEYRPSGSGLWPTPASRDWKDTPGMTLRRKSGRRRDDQLARRVYATPQARDHRTGESSRWMCPERSNNLNDQIGGLLNPTFVEWLMGFPLGWTELKD